MPDTTTKRPWTAEDDARLAELRIQGVEDAAIGVMLGRTRKSVTKRVSNLRARGDTSIPSRQRTLQWTPERIAAARSMRSDGLTPHQIARRLGTDAVSVGRALRSPETEEDSPVSGGRVRRLVPDHTRTAAALDEARAALVRAQERHREAMDALTEPVWAAIQAAGLIVDSEGDEVEDGPAWALVDHLRRQDIELRRVA